MRLLPTILLVSLSAACTFTPPGECESAADCFLGARCESGVCVMGCDADEHCAGDWEQCDLSIRRCALREGRCAGPSQCQAWEVCGTGHTCEVSPSFCAAETDCADHEDCNLSTHLCELQPGRCNSLEDCSYGVTPWASCDSGNYCTYAPTDDVMMWGTLAEGSCGADAVSPVESPERAKVGFGCDAGSNAVLMPSGEVFYFEGDTSSSKNVLRAFTPDPFKWQEDLEYWQYPQNPYANDRIIPTPGCAPDDSPNTVVVQAVTGRILYSCDGANWINWYDTSGNLLVTSPGGRVWAWNRDGLFLRSGASYTYDFEVVDAEGTATAVTGLPPSASVLDIRADGSGFWIALVDDYEPPPERWRVDALGVATRQVVYADPPEGITVTYGGILSRSGALYSEARNEVVFNDLVIRRSPDGSTSSVVYQEADQPEDANDTNARTLKLYNLLHISYLFAGP